MNGLELNNDDGKTVIDDTYYHVPFHEKRTFTSTQGGALRRATMGTGLYDQNLIPMVFTQFYQDFFVEGLRYESGEWRIILDYNNVGNYDLYLFSKEVDVVPTGYGLATLTPDGEVLYTTSHRYINVISFAEVINTKARIDTTWVNQFLYGIPMNSHPYSAGGYKYFAPIIKPLGQGIKLGGMIPSFGRRDYRDDKTEKVTITTDLNNNRLLYEWKQYNNGNGFRYGNGVHIDPTTFIPLVDLYDYD